MIRWDDKMSGFKASVWKQPLKLVIEKFLMHNACVKSQLLILLSLIAVVLHFL